MRDYLLVAFGGALGTVGRFWLASMISERSSSTFPWATLLINVSGSFAIALFAGLTGSSGIWTVRPEWRQFFMVGICGGFTTFSAFSLQTLTLMQEEKWRAAGANVVSSVTLCLLAAWLGFLLAAALHHSRANS